MEREERLRRRREQCRARRNRETIEERESYGYKQEEHTRDVSTP